MFLLATHAIEDADGRRHGEHEAKHSVVDPREAIHQVLGVEVHCGGGGGSGGPGLVVEEAVEGLVWWWRRRRWRAWLGWWRRRRWIKIQWWKTWLSGGRGIDLVVEGRFGGGGGLVEGIEGEAAQ